MTTLIKKVIIIISRVVIIRTAAFRELIDRKAKTRRIWQGKYMDRIKVNANFSAVKCTS